MAPLLAGLARADPHVALPPAVALGVAPCVVAGGEYGHQGFAVAVQQHLTERYPTLMRPLLLRNSRYNQHATTGSLLVEVGTAGNAPEEAELAARLFAAELAKTLEERSK